VTTATTTHTRQTETFETMVGLALLWLVPVVAFLVALVIGW